MGTLRCYFNTMAIMVMLSLIAVKAVAEIKPLVIQDDYGIYFGQLPIGEIAVDAEHTGSVFHLKADVRLTGVASLISNHQSQNHVQGTLQHASDTSFALAKREYHTRYTSGEGWRSIKLAYDNRGTLIRREVEATPEMRRRTPIADKDLVGVSDSLTFVFAAREAIANAHQQQDAEVALRFFDGKRLSQVDFHIYGIVSRNWLGQDIPVLKVGVRRTLLAGYTPKEWKKASDHPWQEAMIYFTANDAFTPVLMELPLKLGTFRAVMGEKCYRKSCSSLSSETSGEAKSAR